MYTNKEMLPYGLEKYHPFFFPEALPKWTVSVKSNVPPERPQKALITLGKKMYHLRDLCKYQNMRHGETLFERDLELKRVGCSLWKRDPCANHIPPTSNLITYAITPKPAHSALSKSAKFWREVPRQKEKLIHWVWTVCPSRCMCSKIELLIYRVCVCLWPVILLLMTNPLGQLKVEHTQGSKELPGSTKEATQLRTNDRGCPSIGTWLRDWTHQEQSSDHILTFVPGVPRSLGLLVRAPSRRLVYSTQQYRMYLGELADKNGK